MSTPNPCEFRKQSPFQKIGKLLVVCCFLVAAYYGYNAHKETEAAQANEASFKSNRNPVPDNATPSLKSAGEKGDTKPR
ncbi:hypothetical protein NB640_03650 [Oxalobacter vibrioformis]|uniref:Uncharacterized protein n=1 Tax=Oxalobacter vibrioformis TaxID=933080 RepID=A0A9E9LXN5_9BURK|nr:hypothetical protein [Oxalobacter vibrioformis]WAW10759.1 hypothetical protein NB640_03650 [Oxalobacter vibrioformis]